MIYIDGLGYMNDSLQRSGSVSSTKNVSFDSILATETAELNSAESTRSLEDIFKEASDKYNIPLDLLKAIGYTESRYQADATSYVGAMGIMQLMPSTAKSLGVEDAYDPYQNIMGAAKLLSQLSDMYDGDQKLMLAAYNAGSGNVAKYGGIPPFEETQNYVAKVLNLMQSDLSVPDKSTQTDTPVQASTDKAMAADTGSVIEKTGNTGNFYSSSKLDDIFSYSDYEIFMSYFEEMLKIISRIGDTDNDSDYSSLGDASLQDLFRLGNSNISYNKSNINLL